MVTLQTMVRPRLEKNLRLTRALARGRRRVWASLGASGLEIPVASVQVDANQLERLFRFIGKGLLWFHWRVYLKDAEHSVVVQLLNKAGEDVFEDGIFSKMAPRVSADLGNGTFRYEGIRHPDDEAVSVWRIWIYGGLQFCDPDHPENTGSQVAVYTCPRQIADSA